MVMEQAAGKLTIDLRAIRDNYDILRAQVGSNCRVAGVVKANAYGLGADRVGPALYEAGCRDFFVSSINEALALRQVLRGGTICVLNGFYNSAADLYAENGFVPALGSFMEIESYRKLAAKQGRKLPAWLSFNTRMNRLGLGSVETEKLLADQSMLRGLEITGVMSHFACADEAGHPLNEIQFGLFNEIAAHFPQAKKSLCNSSGIFRDNKYHFDLVRPGMALYGLNPTPEKPNPMKSVIALSAPIVRIRLVYKDSSVGYGATYRFEKDTQLATVSAGYADGIFRALSNKGALYWKGYRCPIRGRVSMDLTTVDLSSVPEKERPRPGDFIELIGSHQSADALAEDAGTIGYEILTSLGNRYERIYLNESEAISLTHKARA